MDYKKKTFIPFTKEQREIICSLLEEWKLYIKPQNNEAKNKELINLEICFSKNGDDIVEITYGHLILLKDWAIGRRDNLISDSLGKRNVTQNDLIPKLNNLIKYLASNIEN